MEKSTAYQLKVSLSLVGLLAAIYFTFTRLMDESSPGSPNSETSTEEPKPEAEASEVKPKSTEPERSSKELSGIPKALDWDGYLNYDPFEGLDQTNAALFALSMEPSPFFSDEIPKTGKDLKNGVPGALQQIHLSAILTSTDRRLAVIEGRPYGVGDKLQDPMGNLIEDPEVGALEIIQIDLDRAVFKAAGRVFTVKLQQEPTDFVKMLGENSPKSEEKKDE